MVVSKRTSTALKPSIQAFVRSTIQRSLYISSSNKYFTGISPVSYVWTDVGYDSVGIRCDSKIISVKSCVKIGEKSVSGNAGGRQLFRNLINPVAYFKKVGMFAALRLRHGQWQSLSVYKIERVCGRTLLPALIFNLFHLLCMPGYGIRLYEKETDQPYPCYLLHSD